MNRPVCSICNVSLSSKQRLISHMKSKHGVNSDEPCYKLYKWDPAKVVPKSTYYRNIVQAKCVDECDHNESETEQNHSNAESEKICTGQDLDEEKSEQNQSNTEQNQLTYIDHDTCKKQGVHTAEDQENNVVISEVNKTMHFTDTEHTVEDQENNVVISEVNKTMHFTDTEHTVEDQENIDNTSEVDSTMQFTDTDGDYDFSSDDDSLDSDSGHSDSSEDSQPDTKCLTEEEEIHMSFLAYSSRHCLNQEASADLLKLFSLSNNCEALKLSNSKLKDSIGKFDSNIHDFCAQCQTLFPEDESVVRCTSEQCQGLRYKGTVNEQHLKRRHSFFVSTDITSQIKYILEKENMFQTLKNYKEACAESDSITDILNGEFYKKLTTEESSTCTNITLMFNTDGVPLYNSSKVSIWPVYLVINELPPSSRFSRQNMILWGVWQGKGKPNFHTFLKPFVKDMILLRNNGFPIQIQKEELHVKATLIAGSLDLQAKAMVLNMTHHNGEYGCSTCEEPGLVVQQGRGHTRVYPFRNVEPSMRKSEEMLQCGLRASREEKTVKGIKGVSVLHAMQWFCLIVCIVPDYMHGVLLGMTKKLITLYFSPVNSGKRYFLGKSLKEIDKILLKMKPSDAFSRLPRQLEQHYHHYKASELQNWLLFYSLPCLTEYLDESYKNHLALMIEGIYLLLCDNITTQSLARADTLLHQFYQKYEDLYGLNNMTLNLHNMCDHLAFYVRQLGPIWAWSCFPFEDMNGSVLERLHGTGNVCQQILWNVHIQKRLITDAQYISNFQRKQFVQNMVRGQRQVKVKFLANNCNIAGGRSVINLTNNDELKRKIATVLDIGLDDIGKVFKVLRIILNDQVVYSREYTRMESRISNVVVIKTDTDILTAAVQYFLLHEQTNKCIAVVKIMETAGLLHPTVNHMKLFQNLQDEEFLFDVCHIKEKLLLLGGNDKFPCVASLPSKLGLCG